MSITVRFVIFKWSDIHQTVSISDRTDKMNIKGIGVPYSFVSELNNLLRVSCMIHI